MQNENVYFSGLIPVGLDGDIAKFKFLSWRTALSVGIWLLMPYAFMFYALWSNIDCLINHGMDKYSITTIVSTFSLTFVMFGLHFARTKIIVGGKISINSMFLFFDKLFVPGFLLSVSGLPTIFIFNTAEYFTAALVYSVAIIAVSIQFGAAVLVFNICVGNILRDSKLLGEEQFTKTFISDYKILIEKYTLLKDNCGEHLLFLCSHFAIIIIIYLYQSYKAVKNGFIEALAYLSVAIGAILLLAVVTSLAEKAFTSLFTNRKKLR